MVLVVLGPTFKITITKMYFLFFVTIWGLNRQLKMGHILVWGVRYNYLDENIRFFN